LRLICHEEIDVVRKQLKYGSTDENERAVLELLSRLEHPNIVQFLGSYNHRGARNLLFLHADMNLHQFLAQGRSNSPRDLLEEMYGIADALSKIHHFRLSDGGHEISKIGYHHDLRPHNILVKGEKFMIADFGLSRIKPDDQTSKSRLHGGHDDYLGPEAFNHADLSNGSVGRALDIWAFGCILSEVATVIEGKSVSEFYQRREATHSFGGFQQTDQAFHLNGQIRPAVTSWLTDLATDCRNKQTPDLVSLILDMLNPNPFKRIKFSTVRERLWSISKASRCSEVLAGFRRRSLDAIKRDFSSDNLLLLEQKLFEAWMGASRELNHGSHFLAGCGTLRQLETLSGALVEYEAAANQRQNTVEPGLSSLDLFRDVSSAMDILCMSLPTTNRRIMHEDWVAAVCSIQNSEILAAIRSAPNPERYRVVGVHATMTYMARLISSSAQSGRKSRILDIGCIELDDDEPGTVPGAKQSHGDSQQHNDEELYTVSGQGIESTIDHSRSYGYYHSSYCKLRAVIEWKPYDHRWQDGPGRSILRSLDVLVDLFDPEVTPRSGILKHQLLNCVGYFHQPAHFRFGLVYILPSTSCTGDSSTNSVQLYSLNNFFRLTDPDQTDATRPDLGDVFQLAKSLSVCLLGLHQHEWYHKAISSHCILLFSQSQDDLHIHVASAVLVGFGDSRKADGISFGPKHPGRLYQHPLYAAGVPFRRSFDYYGLGIVLLELGLWRPISLFRNVHPEIADEEEFRKKLLKSYVPMLGERMGRFYKDAVRFCLDADHCIREHMEATTQVGYSDEIADPHALAESGHRMFRDSVVQVLSKCSA
jgi:Protein kinase domain